MTASTIELRVNRQVDWRRLQSYLLIAWFTFQSTGLLVGPILGGLPFGWDAVVYTSAARALVEGGDSWRAMGYAIPFAAPPPSLIPFLPFVWLPDPVVSVAWIGIDLTSAVYAIRRLRMPLWWLLFPPLALGIAAGSGAVFALALLVRGGVVADGIAVLTRIYVGLPLAVLGRWRSVAVSIGALALTAPFLAWPTFLAEREHVSTILGANAGTSATAVPWMVPVAILCLVLLGRRRAGWLLIPALWPLTQPYYAVMALPVLAELPLVAVALAIPIPGLVVAGMAGHVTIERIRLRSPAPVISATTRTQTPVLAAGAGDYSA
jgi:hypothetical protein